MGHFLNKMIAQTPPKCTELILTGGLAKTRSWGIVNPVCLDLDKLIGFHDVGGQLIAINATSIQANCVAGFPGH